MTVIDTPRRALPARHTSPTVVILTVLAAVLFGAGWVAGKISIPLGWAWAAVRVGWSDSRGGV